MTSLPCRYLIHADRDGLPAHIARGLDASERATALAPRLPEAHFNRALALERISLFPEACDAWRLAEALEKDSLWGAEAGARCRALEQRPTPLTREQFTGQLGRTIRLPGEADLAVVVETRPQWAREFLDEVLWPAWARATLDRHATAGALQQQIIRLAGVVSRVERDSFSARAAAVLSGRAPSSASLVALARGHDHLARARALYAKPDLDAAVRHARASSRILNGVNHPFRGWAELLLARIEYQRNSLDEALGRLAAVRKAHLNAHVLAARALWIEGLSHNARGEFTRAKDIYTRAREQFASAGEHENEIAVLNLQAEVSRTVGDVHTAWAMHLSALQAIERVDARTRRLVLTNLALTFEQQGLANGGMRIQRRIAAEAAAAGDLVAAAEAAAQNALLLASLGRNDEAAQDLARARSSIGAASDATIRSLVAAQLDAAEASVFATTEPLRAVDASTRAVADLHGCVAPSPHSRAATRARPSLCSLGTDRERRTGFH